MKLGSERASVFALSWALLATFGCGESRPVSGPASSSSPAAPGGQSPSPVEKVAGGVRWLAPNELVLEEAPRPMRLATYRLKGDSAVELSVSEAGGDVDSNVSRWRGQFGNAVPEIAESQRSGLTITEVKLRGTYVGMGNTPAGENYAMRVAIVSQPNAPSHLFFKMVGPADAVQGANALFDQLVASLAPSP